MVDTYMPALHPEVGNHRTVLNRPRSMMSVTSGQSSTTPPGWPHCGRGSTAEDPVGCRGINVPGRNACLPHLNEVERAAYLSTLVPGADIDHRGTSFTEELLSQLFDALRDHATGQPRIGAARFTEATFDGTVRLDKVTFEGTARFRSASFNGATWVRGVAFNGDTQFDKANFNGNAWFDKTLFNGTAQFRGVIFGGTAGFNEVTFNGTARFREVVFSSATHFSGAVFKCNAQFHRARFEAARQVGPLASGGVVWLDDAVFNAPVTLEVSAKELSCRRVRWASTAALRLRYASVDLTGAVMEYPVTLAAELAPMVSHGGPTLEEVLADSNTSVKITSLAGVDTAHLALTDVNLSECRFTGVVHLDQLHMGGRTTFAHPPIGWHRRGLMPLRWSRRRTLAEEHYWRAASRDLSPNQEPSARGWRPGPQHPNSVHISGPETLAALYRQLRKALEDGKNEPGAADFYYGECEMRRHDRESTSKTERVLLHMYWALSGYGLRASRALAWLAVAITTTMAVMVLWGIPVDSPKQTTTGRQAQAGQNVTLVTDIPDPTNPTSPLINRVTSERFEKSLRVVINSVIFRSSGQDLTTAGTYTEMASRMIEPSLLGLAVLAVRSRVKR
ncbi:MULTISPECIES: pentapeptide repeat-containing protein [Streptomyces]|uniref:Pentapeptide repeat-containing protein n=2 Tax=Streptomyces TaxID=1883 RepID=A0ABW6ZBX6_9ACTN|nr:pentapeptide repeat-containing protein [Streptomyces sp. DSM 40868]